MSTEPLTSFPLEARVILRDLQKAPDLNGKKGIIRSDLSSAGRHSVYIEDLDKCVGLKPLNLRYEPISLESLSVKELKMILEHKNQRLVDSVTEKSDLRARVSECLLPSDKLPELLANAKAKPKASSNSGGNFTSANVSPADQLSNMSPDQLRQQARMMRTMDPSMIRRMNPQLANMTDFQLRQAADQMEMMANNPSMMKMASEKMKNMDPTELRKMQEAIASGNNNTNGFNTGNAYSTTASQSAGTPTPSINQAKQAAKMMQNMDPEQLKSQAQMLKTMDPDVLRRTNPQLAHMSDAQIRMAATQFEMMASNPAMMKMAADQMANVTPEQLKAMSNGQKPTEGGSIPGAVPMGGDPAEMLSNMDTAQVKEMLNTVKENPEMLKQFAAMSGIDEDQLKRGVDSFAGMDEAKIDMLLKLMKMGQRTKNVWNQVNTKVGGYLNLILSVMVAFIIYSIVCRFFLKSESPVTVESPLFSEGQYDATDDELESEF